MSTAENVLAPVELDIQGMHCAGCVATVEGALRRVPGVAAASVNLATEHASVSFAAEIAPPPTTALVEAVRSAGYQARVSAGGAARQAVRDERAARLRGERRRLSLALLLGLPVVAGHLVHAVPVSWVPGVVETVIAPVERWPVQALLTLAVLVVAAGPMIGGALRGLVAGSANMDLLVSLGALTAFVSSLVGATTHTHELVFFDAAVVIVLFVGLGKHLEARARGQTSVALEALLSRIPRTALRVTNGQTEAVRVEDVRPGDRLRVAAQLSVPVDGEIVSGRAAIDEAMLTGESLPAERTVGQPVFGGTRVLDGMIDIHATATGSDSAAARIAKLVEQAQAVKPPWQRFADRVATVFVPAVILLALATLAGWKWMAGAETFWALQRTIAVLVVACPCALGLAIPTAVLVGTTRAAEHGILVRDASALEAAGQVREVLLDKTGTLTIGQPALERIERLNEADERDVLRAERNGRDARTTLNEADERDVLRAAAALEQLSEHPLARALVGAARQRGITPPEPVELKSRPGSGVSGVVDRRQAVVGSAAWLNENGINTAPYDEQADVLSAAGFSVVWVGLSGRAAALLGFADPLHPESTAAIIALRQLGVRIRILSGDRLAAVSHVASRLGIDTYEGQLSPAQKLARVRELAGRGHPVAMVGDGINDAPALAAADVGFAIGTGADVARETADICLVGHSPRLIAEAIRISRASARVMKQNLFWAVAYNLVMLPVAMLTALPPAVATAAMMLSSLTVVGNALRLRRII